MKPHERFVAWQHCNIVEGCAKRGASEFRRFLDISQRQWVCIEAMARRAAHGPQTFKPPNRLLGQLHDIAFQPAVLAGQNLLSKLEGRDIFIAPQAVELRADAASRLPAE